MHLNALRLSTAMPNIVFKHHFVAMPMEFKKVGVVVFYSIYLVSGAGFHSIKFDILQSLVAHVKSCVLPYIVGGDFNYEQAVIISWLRTIGLVSDSVAATSSTCKTSTTSSNIDYFVLSSDLACLGPSATLDNTFFHSHHVPVDLLLHITIDVYVDAIRKPPAIPAVPLQGPVFGEVDWSQTNQTIAEMIRLFEDKICRHFDV